MVEINLPVVQLKGVKMEERKEVNEVDIKIRFDTAFLLGLGVALGMLVAFLIPWIIMMVVIAAGV